MPEHPGEPPAHDDDTASAQAERRRLLDRIFGDPLPDATTDERRDPDGSSDRRDDDLRRDVPPHHS
jgi:hypothetical protein